MQSKFFIKSTQIAKTIMEMKVSHGNTVLDATMGNGHDTAFLADLVGDEGIVFSFDIQDIALENTKNKLNELGLLNRVKLIKDSHENIDDYINDKVDLAIFNLGYLPSGNHSIITKPDSTLKAIKKVLELLSKHGILLVVVYYGHQGGNEEKKCVEDFLKSLDQREFNTLKFDFINQKNNPPVLIGVEKKG
ncbi:tRNA (mnm(5)s(2)U34)-methyltransferase [Sporosalibacterium faouarense]|uniref:tRNA (mnm(5)s(2)U34)-methyltransferase n=1 Tax=Sporosalibacterium faouarense TaxID=516123 RepID=UPI00192B8E2B|nr:class I SAM-dependent methyltransferase [Sporosalibacterium faouarense]